MALNFPGSPTDGQQYVDPATGLSYTYNSYYGYWQADDVPYPSPTGNTSSGQILFNQSQIIDGDNCLTFDKANGVMYVCKLVVGNTINTTSLNATNGITSNSLSTNNLTVVYNLTANTINANTYLVRGVNIANIYATTNYTNNTFLRVIGRGTATGNIIIDIDNPANSVIKIIQRGNGRLFTATSNSNVDSFVITSQGRVGIGGITNPATNFEASGAKIYGLQISKVPTPSSPNPSDGGSGSLTPLQTVYTKLVAVDAFGRTTSPSVESSYTTSATSINYSWAAVPGAVSYQLWYSTVFGTQTQYISTTGTSYTLTSLASGTSGTLSTSDFTGTMSVGVETLSSQPSYSFDIAGSVNASNYYISGKPLSSSPKGITIPLPGSGDSYTIMYTGDYPISMSKIHAVSVGDTFNPGIGTSVQGKLYYGRYRNSVNGTILIFNSGNTWLGNVYTSFANTNIPANSFIWVEVGSTINSPSEFHMSFYYSYT